jgi:hypothetical protein
MRSFGNHSTRSPGVLPGPRCRIRISRAPRSSNCALGNDRHAAVFEHDDIRIVDDKQRVRFDGFTQGFRPLRQVDIRRQCPEFHGVDVVSQYSRIGPPKGQDGDHHAGHCSHRISPCFPL